MEKVKTNIIERNLDVEHIMHASCQYGVHGFGKENIKKQFAMLVTADIHGCGKQFYSAIEYLNYYDALDCGICLGDMQPCNYANANTWYVDGVNKSNKPFLTTIGNHDMGNSAAFDISATPEMAFKKFVEPTLSKIGVDNLDKNYYLRKFEKYNIAVLVLNVYDMPDTLDENGNYKLHRGFAAFSQTQVDYIIKALNELPSEYHLIIAMHSFPYMANTIPSSWNNEVYSCKEFVDNSENYFQGDMLLDIVNAWINGKSLKKEYSPKNSDVLQNITVNCDFSSRGKGIFVGYFVGHYHYDIVGVSAKYNNQMIISFPSTAMDTWQNYNSDLARTEGTKTEDLLTVVSVHTERREIRLVRIGSNFTIDMKNKTFAVFKY